MNKKRNGSGTELGNESNNPEPIADVDLLTDDDTAELPVLDLAGFEEDPASFAESEGEIPDSRAARWVRHAEDELERLRARWNILDEELAEAKDQIAALHDEVEGKDARIAELLRDLESVRREAEAREARIAEREQSIASLEQAAAERDGRLTEAFGATAIAEDRLKALDERVEAANQEAATLRNALQDEQARAAELRAEKNAVAESNATLREKLQTLESYIEGRREKWYKQSATLESHAAAISSLEAELVTSDARIAERDARIETLETRIHELERDNGELEGRHREREAAHKETDERLQKKIAEIEKLEARLAQRDTRAEEAREDAALHREKFDALEASLDERDQTIRRLEADLDKIAAVNSHIEEQQRADRGALDELHEKAAKLEAQRDELAAALDEARAGADALSGRLDASERSVAELEARNHAQQAQIAALETALESRAEVIAGFDAHAEQLDRLSRQLTAIHDAPEDSRNPGEANEGSDAEDAAEHVATHADISDRAPARQQRVEHTEDRSLLTDLDLDAADGRHHVLVRLTDDNDDGAVHVLSKPVTTIGRSHASDIRIGDPIVSRTHARLTMDDVRVTIEDAGSKNGLMVNAEIVERAVLRSGDIVSFGAYEFRYVELDPPALTH